MDDQHFPVEWQKGRAIVDQASRVDQVSRRRPGLAIMVQSKTVPDLARTARQRMVAHQEPDPAARVGGDSRQALPQSQMAPRLLQ